MMGKHGVLGLLVMACCLTAYTRQKTLAALECVLKSVKLHKSVDGPQGYLGFIEGFIP